MVALADIVHVSLREVPLYRVHSYWCCHWTTLTSGAESHQLVNIGMDDKTKVVRTKVMVSSRFDRKGHSQLQNTFVIDKDFLCRNVLTCTEIVATCKLKINIFLCIP